MHTQSNICQSIYEAIQKVVEWGNEMIGQLIVVQFMTGACVTLARP